MFVARFPFQYGVICNRLGELNGKPYYVDRGEVVELRGYANDEKLVGLGYFVPLRGEKTQTCDICGRKFVSISFSAHQRKRDCWDLQGEPTALDLSTIVGRDIRVEDVNDGETTFDPASVLQG